MNTMPTKSPNWKTLRLYFRYWGHYPLLASISVLFSLVLALQNTVTPLLVALALGEHFVGEAFLFDEGGEREKFPRFS